MNQATHLWTNFYNTLCQQQQQQNSANTKSLKLFIHDMQLLTVVIMQGPN